ncbi:MAG TPA: polyprenol monophosphomannose synthase [Acidimicrobiia bacterium]|nr:polyprenol monophosphomannose synthase [Acidimicrobiia bacterium]
MRTLVVMPTYEEAANVAAVLHRVRGALPDGEVLVVDDDSPDGTADVATSLARDLGGLHVMRRPGKDGLGRAYRAGFAWGVDRGFDILCQMDADLSHEPEALPSLIAPVLADRAELVIGSRYVPGGRIPAWPRRRRALSRVGNWYGGFALGVGVHDVTSGYRAYRADAVKAAGYDDTQARGYGFLIEMAYRIWQRDGRIVEVPITFRDRVRGESKMSLSVAVEELRLVTWWGLRDLGARRRRRAPLLPRAEVDRAEHATAFARQHG